MHEKQVKNLQPFKMVAAYGGGFGIILLLFSIFENDYNLILGLGVGLTASSIFLFLFGIFLASMEEYTIASKRKVPMARASHQFYY